MAGRTNDVLPVDFFRFGKNMAKDKTQLLRLLFIDRKIHEGMRSGIMANCSSMAAEYAYTLNELPTCRCACVARLNFDSSKL